MSELIQMTPEERKELGEMIKTVKAVYNIELDSSDPSLCAFYVYSRLFSKLQKQLNDNLTQYKNATGDFNQELSLTAATSVAQMKELCVTQIDGILNDNNQRISDMCTNAANAVLERVRQTFAEKSEEMAGSIEKLKSDLNAHSRKLERKLQRIYILLGVASGFLGGLLVAALILVLRF